MQDPINVTVLPAHVDLANVFMDLNKRTSTIKEKSSAQRRLAARRGIEAHYEKKQLEENLKEFWEDI